MKEEESSPFLENPDFIKGDESTAHDLRSRDEAKQFLGEEDMNNRI
jgi:hypothetical protein